MQSLRTIDAYEIDGRLRWSAEASRLSSAWPQAEQGLLNFRRLAQP